MLTIQFLESLRIQFNSSANYRGLNYQWDSIILQKTRELANYILGKSRNLDFSKPLPDLERFDTKELREKILVLSVPEARKIGISKSTLWYLQERAQLNKPLRIYNKSKLKIL